MKPRLILIDSEKSKHIRQKDERGDPISEMTISGVEASRNIFKRTETMIELKGMEFTLKGWTLTGNGPRPKGNAPGQPADEDTNQSFIQVYIGYDQTVLVEGMNAHNNYVKLGQFFKIIKNYDEANISNKEDIVPSFHLSGCTFRDNVGG